MDKLKSTLTNLKGTSHQLTLWSHLIRLYLILI